MTVLVALHARWTEIEVDVLVEAEFLALEPDSEGQVGETIDVLDEDRVFCADPVDATRCNGLPVLVHDLVLVAKQGQGRVQLCLKRLIVHLGKGKVRMKRSKTRE